MFVIVALRRFLCLFALLGVGLGPVSVGTANALALSSAHQMQAVVGVDQQHVMSDCAEQQPAQKKDCGPACPLALICSSIVLAHDDTTDGWRVDIASCEQSHGLLEEGDLPSAIVEPPAPPPKA